MRYHKEKQQTSPSVKTNDRVGMMREIYASFLFPVQTGNASHVGVISRLGGRVTLT